MTRSQSNLCRCGNSGTDWGVGGEIFRHIGGNRLGRAGSTSAIEAPGTAGNNARRSTKCTAGARSVTRSVTRNNNTARRADARRAGGLHATRDKARA